MPLPIRIRLSVSYFVIFLLAGVFLCGAAYLMARHSLYIAVEHELDEHIDDVRDFLQVRGLAADSMENRSQIAAEFAVKDDGKWLQMQDEHGNWIFRSRRMMIAPHALPPASQIPPSGRFIEFGVGPKRVRALVRVFSVDGHPFVVESGATLTKTNQTLADFRNGLLLISPVVFLMAGLAGHMLSRRALDPVAAIAREAQRIHDGNLQTRLPRLDTRDELAHLSSTLNEMLERIESGVRSVRDFTAYASHELRTPVALIRTEADLALHFDRSSREYREALSIIAAEALRMSSLLDSLLFLARTDAGTEQVQLEPVDARRISLQAWEKLSRLSTGAASGRSRLKLISELPAEPVLVMADSGYLQRLLTILLENAAKYTPAGGHVGLLLQGTGGRARFEVRDSGIGIPIEEQARIFERFFRASNARETDAQGSGLGLALAAWIAERHQTEIQVSSTPGSGSSFSWTLPLAPQELTQQVQDKSWAAEEINPLAAILR